MQAEMGIQKFKGCEGWRGRAGEGKARRAAVGFGAGAQAARRAPKNDQNLKSIRHKDVTCSGTVLLRGIVQGLDSVGEVGLGGIKLGAK